MILKGKKIKIIKKHKNKEEKVFLKFAKLVLLPEMDPVRAICKIHNNNTAYNYYMYF